MFGEMFGENLGFSMGLVGIEFLVGLILGLLVKKGLKIIIIVAILFAVGSYFGAVAVNWDMVAEAGGTAVALGSVVFTLLPLGAGLLVGGIIGFVKG
ncbi:hypothetical protein FP804_05210 [archaeon]|nr:hypothetical protein [archaeon]MBU2564660.1 hypothetical protein [Candidatus Thermoplasmatota archaeon]MCG2825382.1 hypothetical protein [Thermoplasmatales archaeon]